MADCAASATATTTTHTKLVQPKLHLQQPAAAAAAALAKAPAPPSSSPLAKVPAADALRILSASLETLVRLTGDIPPTPPPKSPTDPQMSGLQAEKEIIAKSQRGPGSANGSSRSAPQRPRVSSMDRSLSHTQQPPDIDGVRLRASPPPASAAKIIAADARPLNTQHSAITRKFYSKLEPPISITQYLVRLHQFCPMSTAVYIATSLYIHRLAVEQRAIHVTRRNVHRLVLAGLRVATKALEDLAYPHAKVAKVGGVSEPELARLEISFCFLAGFELVIGEEMLRAHWATMREDDGDDDDGVNGRGGLDEKTHDLRIGKEGGEVKSG